jgi:chromatin remodeling complex protein RSC6
MVRTSKSSVEKQVAAPVVDAPVVNVSKENAAPAVKKTKKTKAVEQVVDASVSAVVSDTTTNVDVSETSVASSLTVMLLDFSNKINQLSSYITSLKSEYKTLEKQITRDVKNAEKLSNRRKKTSGNRQPSGFVKPTPISDELAVFLSEPSGTELARTAVSRRINEYIRTNNLQDKVNGRKIIPDAKLSKLLNIKKDEELTYFNLQRYMKHHFIKTASVVSPAPVTV